jgi:hypothetical protein
MDRPLFDETSALLSDELIYPLDGESMTSFKSRIWSAWREQQPTPPITPNTPTHRPQQRISLETSPLNQSEPMSLREIAELMGVSGESVRKIERQAIAKCNLWLSDRGLTFADLV